MLLGPEDLSPALVQYALVGGHDRVEGWLEPGALAALLAFCAEQRRLAASGGVVEIGVHHGRFFLPLCMSRREGERAVAIDVFENQHLNVDASGHGDRERLEANLDAHLGSRDGVIIEQEDSLALDPDRILALLDGVPARLFSVDGCHTEQHTSNDLELARDVLSPQGLIVLDDYANPEWPEVGKAAERFFAGPRRGDLEPIASTNNKLFIARAAYAPRYRLVFEEIVRQGCGTGAKRPAHGFDVWFGDVCPPEDLLSPSAFRALMGRDRGLRTTLGSGTLPTHHVLVDGWATPEVWGVWTDGPKATLRLKRPVVEDQPVRLDVAVHAFMPAADLPQSVAVSVNGHALCTWRFENGETTQRTAIVPAEIVAASSELELTFDIANPCSPRELGRSDDRRRLGIALRRVRLTPGTD